VALRGYRVYWEKLNAGFLCCNGDIHYQSYAYGDALTLDEIQEILDERGLDTLLEEHYLTLPFVLSLLDELGYMELERYKENET